MEPSESTRISLGVYLNRHATGNSLYVVLVILMIAGIAVLPVIYVDVCVGSPGMLRPVSSVAPIKSLSSGVVTNIRARENLRVKKGEALVFIHSAALSDRQRRARERMAVVSDMLKDVGELMLRVQSGSNSVWRDYQPATPLYQQLLAEFAQAYWNIASQLDQAKRDHVRSRTLFDNGVIASSEMEQADEALRKNEDAVLRLVHMHLTAWQQNRLKYEQEIAELKGLLLEVEHVEDQNQIVASISGTVHELTGLYPGSAVLEGQEIGYISPDTALVAEVHVSPGDIGMIREGLPVNFQIAAYNYNEWGILQGSVAEVPNEVMMEKNDVYYRVMCRLSQEYLQLPNGHRGSLRKGMTLHARFVVGRRSLWRLLYDKTDDWLNPSR